MTSPLPCTSPPAPHTHCHCPPTRPPAGSRTLLIALVGVGLFQPPLAVFLQQAVLVALTASTPAYCRSRLLADPLTRRRLGVAWELLEFVPMLVVPQAAASALASK